MGMNKQTGNMYPFVTHTWNPIRGKCPHECEYCYMKKFKVGYLRLEKRELNTNLGSGNFIFVGSSTDMFAEEVYSPWIMSVLIHCMKYPNNTYLFQTKNPKRFKLYHACFEKLKDVILGTTIESDISPPISNAPTTFERAVEMMELKGRKMISLEPIMEFDMDIMLDWIKKINPEFVSIGADSKYSNLPEPSTEKIERFLIELYKITQVIIKPNMERLGL